MNKESLDNKTAKAIASCDDCDKTVFDCRSNCPRRKSAGTERAQQADDSEIKSLRERNAYLENMILVLRKANEEIIEGDLGLLIIYSKLKSKCKRLEEELESRS